jgi:trigger factor
VIKNKEITHLEHSRVKLSLTIEKEAVGKEYHKLLDDYSKTIRLPGFRPGKVPPAVVERKFGEGLKAEAAQKIVEDSLKTVFEEIEEKPATYETPELQDDYKLSFDDDFQFTVAYDIFPKVEIGPYTGLDIEQPVVKITEDDEKRELDVLVEQNSFIVEKDGQAEKENSATVNYWEVDEAGAEIPGTKKQDMPLVVDAGHDIYGIDTELAGMKKGDTKNITKSYPADYREKDLAGQTKKFVIELTGLREKKKPDLDDELAKDISEAYETLDDLKKDIKKRLEESAAIRTRSLTVDALMDQVVEKSNIDLPESMIRAEQKRLWRQFAGQFRIKEEQIEQLLTIQNKSKDDLFAEWRPRSEKSLKIQLCIQKMLEAEKIEISDEELDAFFKEQSEGASMSFEELKDYYIKNNLIDMARHDAQEKKLFDQLLEKNTIAPGKEISFTEAMGGKQ